ncbi:MAG: HAMP domain-containing histidine kinase [Clostridiales bacterium]|nr:HAMP domain-containing histidine kinase [Clostridiales bacterium]
MKIKSRIIIAFLIIMFLPAILFGISGISIIKYQKNSIQKEYGSNVDIYDILVNPLQILNKFTRGTYNNISTIANESPKTLEDIGFIEKLNREVSMRFSFIILRKDNEIIYNGSSDKANIEKYLPEFGDFTTDVEGGFYIDTNNPFLLKQKDFYFEDGSLGSIFIITDVRNIIPQIRHSLIQLLVTYIMVTMLTAIVVVYWLYFSILKPLNTLKIATSEISKGNLNYSIEGEPRDEIGQLCIDFDAMRIRIKDLLETQLENEKNTKELVSNISHDLKTPITAIIGYSEGIIDGVADTPKKQEKYVKTIYKKAINMSVLIDELRLYSQIENNNINYRFTSLNIDNFFSDCIEELSLDLEIKKIKITYDNELDKNTNILADAEQLKKVINNIMVNSVKYIGAKEGLIHINIRDKEEFVEVGISDNGVGIAKEDLPYIFDRFYRTDQSRNSSQGGTGLGLSIAKKIVEDHKGEIFAKSQVGSGTTIYIRLRKYEVYDE